MKVKEYLEQTDSKQIYVGAWFGNTLNLLPRRDLDDVDLDYEIINTEEDEDVDYGNCTILVISSQNYQFLIKDLNDRDRKREVIKAVKEQSFYDWLCSNYHRFKGDEMLDILKEYVYYVETNMFDTEDVAECLEDVL